MLVTSGAFGCMLFGLGLGLRFSEWFGLGFLVDLVWVAWYNIAFLCLDLLLGSGCDSRVWICAFGVYVYGFWLYGMVWFSCCVC